MESRAAWSLECRGAYEAAAASVSVLGRIGTGSNSDECDPDPLRRRAEACLDGLAEVARTEAATAALKVRLAAEYTDAAQAMAAPTVAPRESSAQEMAVIAEVACVLTVSERTAGALLSEAHELTTSLPLTMSALQAGTISWQHARIVVDETTNLDPAGAAALEAHFLDPDAPDPARGCPAGELVPSRFRHKARTWRERHHPVSIEKRHTKGAQDRRLEYAPDLDGMAWLSAYLPAHQASGIWDRTTTAARALQGPHE
nr:13E12 repeat family protein [Actinomycetota bacterium]